MNGMRALIQHTLIHDVAVSVGPQYPGADRPDARERFLRRMPIRVLPDGNDRIMRMNPIEKRRARGILRTVVREFEDIRLRNIR